MAGMPASKRRRELLQHSPDREVERVDMHRGAFQRHVQMCWPMKLPVFESASTSPST